MSETKIICPHCDTEILYESIHTKWMKSDNGFINTRCECKKRIGITQNIQGGLVAYTL